MARPRSSGLVTGIPAGATGRRARQRRVGVVNLTLFCLIVGVLSGRRGGLVAVAHASGAITSPPSSALHPPKAAAAEAASAEVKSDPTASSAASLTPPPDPLSPPSASTDSLVIARYNDSTSEEDNNNESNKQQRERAAAVRRELSMRLSYVASGRRQRDVARFIKAQGGGRAVAVLSVHGAASSAVDGPVTSNSSNVAFDLNAADGSALTRPGPSPARLRPLRYKCWNDDPFPPNRYSLDLVNSSAGVAAPSLVAHQLQPIALPPPTLLQLALRALQLGWNFAPVLSTLGLAVASPSFRNNRWYNWLTSCMGRSGAAWIKWGQWSSTRRDMFPEALCEALSKLHNDAPAHSWQVTQQIVEDSLSLAPGLLWGVFDEFDAEPLASGSIAQVYKAVLDGHWVAVKVRHPRVARLMDLDFRLMGIVARFVDAWIPALRWLHIPDSVQQFSTTLAAQADLHVEAHHLEVLHHNFRRWPHVRFPQPFFASESVILETFEPGRIVTGVIDMYDRLAEALQQEEDAVDRDAATAGGPSVQVPPESGYEEAGMADSDPPINTEVDRIRGHELIPIGIAKFLVTTGLAVYLKMLLVDNLMHADLHPGNIMVSFHRSGRGAHADRGSSALAMVPHDDPYVSSKHLHRLLGICLVDAGMVAQLTDDESSAFIGLLSSLGEGDGAAAAEYALGFSLENNMSEHEREAFTQDMVELFAERCRGYGTAVDVGHVLRGVLGLIRKHRVRIDANFATLVVNCLCVESLGRSFCPSYNVLDAAKPLLRGYRVARRLQSLPSRLYLSLLYARKGAYDWRFFRNEARRLRDRTRAPRLLLDERVG